MIGSYAMSKYVNGDKVCYMAEDNNIEDERVMLNWILEEMRCRADEDMGEGVAG